jgi:hypothetical protein
MHEKLFELYAGEFLAAAIVELKTACRKKAGFGPNIERTRVVLKLLECRIRMFEGKHRCPECSNLSICTFTASTAVRRCEMAWADGFHSIR